MNWFKRLAPVGCWLLPVLLLRAAESESILLPPPQLHAGRALMQVLKDRQTTRDFSTDAVPLPTLANLLWAGFGTNRADGRRTAPSTMNSQEIEIYVALPNAAYVYEPEAHRLRRVAAGDVRARTGGQDFVKAAPLALIFVADLSKLAKARPEDRERYANIDVGFISQNIYLYCASEGLATVVHELDRGELPKLLGLKSEQRVLLAQSVGFPK